MTFPFTTSGAAGDLRGMKYLFLKGRYKDRIKTFLTIDDAANATFYSCFGFTMTGAAMIRPRDRNPDA